MKDRLLKLIEAKKQQRSALNASMLDCDSREERMAIGETLSKLGEEIAELEVMLAEIDDPAPGQDEGARSGLNVVGTMQTRSAQPTNRNVDPHDTEEYRKAFMDFACRNVPMPAEFRGDATTTTTDASAAIPTSILNEIVKELKSYGNLYERVRKLNVQGGVKIPILSLKPTATWITADTATSESDKQKLEANTSVTFSYYGLECKVSQTLLASVVTLAIFQEQFTALAVEAIAKALDIAIINGSGSGEPLGITKDERVTNVVTLSETDALKWDSWKKKVFAKIKVAYNNGLFIMAKGTFDGYIDGMVDGNGQPIGRVNYGIGDGEKYYFGGKEVLIVEPDVLKDWDSATGHASTGDPVVIYCNLKDYAFNTNMEMQTVKWVDNDTNEVKNKVILIADGKLIDPNGVVVVKKGV